MPKRNDNMRRVYAYLINRRGIDRDVIYTFAHCGLIYESEKYHNVVFVGKDNQGIPVIFTSAAPLRKHIQRQCGQQYSLNSVFTGTAKVIKYICLKRPLICCLYYDA
ncbi:MAG: DUF3991 domain-containing protein [Eubacterium sp.]